MSIRKSDKGFTIIEVVIVLAIAGLIFAIVFWALPNLQKNQRDQDRRSVVANVLANLDQFKANNNGKYPTLDPEGPAWDAFFDQFYSCTFVSGTVLTGADCELKDPLADEFTVTVAQAPQTVDDSSLEGTMAIHEGGECPEDGTATTVDTTLARSIAIMVRIENGSDYCVDNNN